MQTIFTRYVFFSTFLVVINSAANLSWYR